MRPKKHKTTGSNDLFRARLDQIINVKHELVLLAVKIDWDWIDGEIAPLHSEDGGRRSRAASRSGCGCSSTFMGYPTKECASAGSTIRISSSLPGEEFFQHASPHERSDLSHWRKRLGDKLELLLAESLRVAHGAGALRGQDLKRVTVDTTVQPKAISFPTDAKLLHAAIKGLNRLATRHGVRLRQSYFSCGQGRRVPLADPVCLKDSDLSSAAPIFRPSLYGPELLYGAASARSCEPNGVAPNAQKGL